MNIAVFLCPASQVTRLADQCYDLVLGPGDSAHPKLSATMHQEIFATTSEYSLEESLLASEMDELSTFLDTMFGEDSGPVIRRGLVLSALKNELRLLIDAKNKMDSISDPYPVSVDVYYTYLTFPGLFLPEHYNVRWIHCSRLARGKMAGVFSFLGKFRAKSFPKRHP